jgi:hypothetical protein
MRLASPVLTCDYCGTAARNPFYIDPLPEPSKPPPPKPVQPITPAWGNHEPGDKPIPPLVIGVIIIAALIFVIGLIFSLATSDTSYDDDMFFYEEIEQTEEPGEYLWDADGNDVYTVVYATDEYGEYILDEDGNIVVETQSETQPLNDQQKGTMPDAEE